MSILWKLYKNYSPVAKCTLEASEAAAGEMSACSFDCGVWDEEEIKWKDLKVLSDMYAWRSS